MSAFENAQEFFHAVDSAEGWKTCAPYVADGAPFTAQSEPLADIATVKDYVDWMEALGTRILPGCSYELHASAWDEESRSAIFFGTFTGTHSGEGGPVPPTSKTTHTDYVYVLGMDEAGKVARMTKIWNAPWAMRELGWT